ncbi:MAG TPA: xylose isomerase [Verrucomicrobiae bacterium]|nr:xylose isomerase [Verrucomicrobiae bacterium]
MQKPILRHIANLWTFMGHPTKENEWTLDQKLRAIKEAGFDGVCWAGSPELRDGCRQNDLIFVGGMASGNAKDFPRLLQEQKDCGAVHVNVQLASDEISTAEALELTLTLNREAKRIGVIPGIETHRGTCTETPEKHYALCDAYQRTTGELLPLSLDFSHFAVVKHLMPEHFAKRLLGRPDLIQHAQQFHFRPFNGHHVQVPITDGRGNLTQEVKDWLPFAEALLKCWLEGNENSAREIFICPELGPIEGGYKLSTFPNSWEEAKVMRIEIEKLWRKVAA